MRARSIQRSCLALIAVVVAVAAASPSVAQTRSDATDTPPGARPRRDVPEDRYAMAGGCYAIRSVAANRPVGLHAPFFFEATDLGRYLLFGTAGDFVTGSGEQVVNAPAPSNDADWVISELGPGAFAVRLTAPDRTLVAAPDGALTLASDIVTSEAARFSFRRTSGCATFPEAAVNVTGPYPRGTTAFEEVQGYLDAHLHMMTFEFFGGRAHCGRPWHPYGVTVALVDCPDHMVANGNGAVLENLLTNGEPFGSHDPVGWPTFKDWPAHRSLTHEQVYYRWMERAWRSGLRLFVNMLTENGALCDLYPLKKNSCDEMTSVRLQNQRIHELERYIDAQSGGPGRGWFRIVTDPFQARRVMNDGRLAVVLGIETSELFGCTTKLGQKRCTTADIDRQLADVEAMGVRDLLLVNKFDNAYGGVSGDGGTLGMVINVGNFYDSGHFWDMKSCDPNNTGVHDNNQVALPGIPNQDAIFGAILQQSAVHAVAPVYPPPPHCNALGLSALGAYTIEQFVKHGMIFDPDHLSVIARQQSLDLLEQLHYPGVISSHGWATPDAYPRIYALGGMTTPYAGDSRGFVDEWRRRKAYAPAGRPCFGIGYGADSNGLGGQGGPRGAGAKNPVRYPFTGLGGVTVNKQVSGQRVYDINVDGVAHYGLYPDWIEDLRHLAGDEIIDDMKCGAEAYLEMWERAGGIAAIGCRTPAALDALTPGTTVEDTLRRAGQPQRRQGSTFSYCLTSGATRVLSFDARGRLLAAAPATPTAPLPVTGAPDYSPAALVAIAVLLFVRARTRGPSRPTTSTMSADPNTRM